MKVRSRWYSTPSRTLHLMVLGYVLDRSAIAEIVSCFTYYVSGVTTLVVVPEFVELVVTTLMVTTVLSPLDSLQKSTSKICTTLWFSNECPRCY